MKVETSKKSFCTLYVVNPVLIIVLGILVVSVIAGLSSGSKSKPSRTPTPTVAILPTPNPIPEVKGEQTQEVLVTRVVDGDTIEIKGGGKVRYIGIDTPETVHPSKPVQCFGYEASNKNKELVEGKIVRLEKDVSEFDKYGRLLRYVWVEDIFVNDYLVRQGYAYSSTYPPDIKYQDRFRQAQQEAMGSNRGLWGRCETQPGTIPQQNGGCLIKGNISYKTGEKIYHLPGCPYYASTVINEDKGERWFCSEDEAQAAGWRKAYNCP